LALIYAIPGLGTTKELFAQMRIPGHEVKVLEWPLPGPNETLAQYASEFIKQINTTMPVNILGVSFGGMLCIELAGQIETNSVVLISSCKNRKELPAHIRALKYVPVHRWISERQHRFIASKSRKIVGFPKNYLPIFRRMIYAMPPHYFTRCIDMIVKWDRSRTEVKVEHIHGDHDLLLLHKKIKGCHTIHGGTHAMIVTKADEINALLAKIYNGL
jgi:pimeloyl-ACP methyl ester carboxylesterase